MSLRIVAVTLALTSAAHAAPTGVTVFESRLRAATTEGIAILAADPDTAYAIATDFANWSRMFPGVRRAVVDRRLRDGLEVTFVRSDGNVDHLRFHTRPSARVVAFEQVGGDADVSAEIAFSPGETAGTTRVHARLHADVHGFASAFVSDSDLRALRQRHVRDDLGHLQAFFRALRPHRS
jgi:hypothetical protein